MPSRARRSTQRSALVTLTAALAFIFLFALPALGDGGSQSSTDHASHSVSQHNSLTKSIPPSVQPSAQPSVIQPSSQHQTVVVHSDEHTHGGENAADTHGHGASTGDSANWYVISGFLLLVAAATAGAAATKSRLARRIGSGELAGAGVRNA